jgi:hypothetical protein
LSRGIRWAGHAAHIRDVRNAYRILVRKPEGKRPLGRPRHRCEKSIKMDLNKIGCEDLTGFIWLRIEAMVCSCEQVMNLQVPQKAGNLTS